MRRSTRVAMCLALGLAALPVAGLRADPTTQQKYDALKAQMAAMARQMASMQKQMAAMKKRQAAMAASTQSTDQKAIDRSVRRLYKKVMKESQKISALEPGNIQVLIAGDVNFQFQHQQGHASTFYADSSPMIQVRVDKNIFINTASSPDAEFIWGKQIVFQGAIHNPPVPRCGIIYTHNPADGAADETTAKGYIII